MESSVSAIADEIMAAIGGEPPWSIGTCQALCCVTVRYVVDQAEFLMAVEDGDDDDFVMVLEWVDILDVDALLAVHCARRAVRLAGHDARSYELVAEVCKRLTGLYPARALVTWRDTVAILVAKQLTRSA